MNKALPFIVKETRFGFSPKMPGVICASVGKTAAAALTAKLVKYLSLNLP